MRCPEGHERLDAPVPALALHVVAGDQPAEAVADDVHAVVPRLLADLLDPRPEVRGPARDVAQQRAVVPGADLAEATLAEAASHHGEHRPVVDEPVHEDHRDASGQGIAGEQGPHAGRLLAGPDARIRAEFLGPGAERIHQQMRPDPDQFGESPGQGRAGAEGTQTTSWRSLDREAGVRLWEGIRAARQPHVRPSPVVTHRRRPGGTAPPNAGAPLVCSVNGTVMRRCAARHIDVRGARRIEACS